MKVLVLGSTGFIGSHLLESLDAAAWAQPTGASRNRDSSASKEIDWMKVDTSDLGELERAITGFDAIVNCVSGNRQTIREGARNLAAAATAAGCPRIVHMSTMSVYGEVEGLVAEDRPLVPQSGWYGEAKRQAEMHMTTFTRSGGKAVIFRPGCVFGPGSESWVGRTARWLKSGRLGDLGEAGNGWSNLVHVDDVCQAVLLGLKLDMSPGHVTAINLAAPDSPRWNQYFSDLAINIGDTPVRRVAAGQVRMDSLLAGVPLKIAEKLMKRLSRSNRVLPEPITPGIVRLWKQNISLDPTRASQKLGLRWTPYAEALKSSARWFSSQRNGARKPPQKASRQPG